MESNEQPELARKMGTDSLIESRMTAQGGGRLGDRGTKQKVKRTHGHGQQCGDCWGERSIRGQSGKKCNEE